MDGWLAGWLAGWLDGVGWMDGWIDGWMNRPPAIQDRAGVFQAKQARQGKATWGRSGSGWGDSSSGVMKLGMTGPAIGRARNETIQGRVHRAGGGAGRRRENGGSIRNGSQGCLAGRSALTCWCGLVSLPLAGVGLRA